jgi:uncharacterized protein (TIGR03084 family)
MQPDTAADSGISGIHQVAADLVAEQDELDAALSNVDDGMLSLPTASSRWTIADQIGHLAFFDETAALAITDPDAFQVHVGELLAKFGDAEAVDDATLGRFRRMDPAELVQKWRGSRSKLAEAAASLGEDTRVVWYGPSMGAKSFLTARLMECWAHGQDIVDAVGITRTPTRRLQHIARLGHITRSWSYVNRGLEVPEAAVCVRLTAPSGDEWVYGDEAAPESISGAAEDFCLVVTQRRHVDDTGLVVIGASALDWMHKAQVFAGPATDGPSPAS